MSMNPDKAYLFGLAIGGGIWGNSEDVFKIRLPYKQWGSYEKNPQRAGQISRDILAVGQMFKSIYGITVSYDTAVSGIWNILCEGDTKALRADLSAYGIECEGELRKNASIGGITANLVDDFMKRRFIAGLADTIGSTNKNHRRFSDNVQILSFELQGFNFSFVCDLCRLLYSVKCFPDQILWNHPNFHCANNPHYAQWTKGFKLRVQLDQYAEFGAFAFSTKAKSALENRGLQTQTQEAVPCPERELRAAVSCVHPAEHDVRLPATIRGGHYLHNRHVCAVLGCEHAPYAAVKNLFSQVGDLITPFPILCKAPLYKIEAIVEADPLLAKRNYRVSNLSVKAFYDCFQANRSELLYGDAVDTGYPITEILQGIAYVIADDRERNGTRPKGSYLKTIARHITAEPDLTVQVRKPDLLTPLVIAGSDRGALVGARNPRVYETLVTIDADNAYKLCVRPISEGDLSHAE